MGFEEDLRKINPSLIYDGFYEELWSAMANTSLIKLGKGKGEYSSDDVYSASFRGSGGVVADLYNYINSVEEKDYLDYYCCGPDETVTGKVEEVLNSIGWTVVISELADIIKSPKSPNKNAKWWIKKNFPESSISFGTPVEHDVYCYATGYRVEQNYYLTFLKKGKVIPNTYSTEAGIVFKIDSRINFLDSDRTVPSGKEVYNFEKDGPVEYEIPDVGSMV